MMSINEAATRLVAFMVVLIAIALWEAAAPRRVRSYERRWRWPSNLAVTGLNTVLLRVLLPVSAVSLALAIEGIGAGLLSRAELPHWVAIVIAIVALDLAIYLQHVMFHAVPALWRVHRMHHADLDFDVTTGARFHPIEIILSMIFKFGVIAALGAPAAGVLLFEVLLNATSMFNHGNIRIPAPIDGYLRWLVVTPDMHRVHHSIVVDETNSNFGFNLPWWDRMLGTYRDQPAAGHDAMTIGIEEFRVARELWLDRMLSQPFRGATGSYPISRKDGPRFTELLTLKDWMDRGKELAIIDVRSPEEFSGPLGHIAGALPVPLPELAGRLPEMNRFAENPIITI